MKSRRPYSIWPALAAACVAVLAAGCASVPPDASRSAVQALTASHLGSTATARPAANAEPRIAALLARPLSADAAVELALLAHRGLQANLAELDIADADLALAASPPNPGLGFARIRGGGETELEWGLHAAIGRLLTMPRRVEVQRLQQQQAQMSVAARLLDHLAEVRRAWTRAVAAEQAVAHARQVMDAAEASAELARRMASVGNFNRLQRTREQAFYAEAALGLAHALAQQARGRERLVRQLGLWGDNAAALMLPARLPDLPNEPAERPQIERLALEQRLDLRAARDEVERARRAIALDGAAVRWTDSLEVGLERSRSSEGERHRKAEIGFELPLFDGARVRRAQGVLALAEHQLAEAAVNARSEVREADAAWRHAWDIARHHRDELVPLQRAISEENLLRYNGMLIGVFELLADARVQIGTVQRSIEALRDFWLAQADLEAALVGRPLLAGLARTAASAPAGADPH